MGVGIVIGAPRGPHHRSMSAAFRWASARAWARCSPASSAATCAPSTARSERIPAPALWVFNNVGLNGFIAGIGLNAAAGLVAGLKTYGIGLVLSGLVVSVVPMIVGLVVGKYVFKLHPTLLLGAIAGARTFTPALGALQQAAQSTLPAVGYTPSLCAGPHHLRDQRHRHPARHEIATPRHERLS